MKFIIIIFFLALARTASAEIPDDVWISLRGDGERGSGTQADPYDGSSEARFDALMGISGSLRSAITHIHLGPGVFMTRGFCLGLNSQLSGAGMDVTTIRLEPGAVKIGRKTEIMTVRGTSATGYDATSVSDLTVDGNILRQPRAPNDICLTSGCVASHIARVKIINLGTTKPGTGMESFWISANSPVSLSTALPSYNQIIEDCVCVAPPIPGYVTFFGSSGQNPRPDSPGTVACRNVILRNDKVVCATPTGTFNGHAFTFANCDSGIIEDCYTDGINVGYYQDTWSSHKIAIRHNVFSRAVFGVFFNGPGRSSGVDSTEVADNYIDMLPETKGQDDGVGVRFYYPPGGNITIRDNRIRLTPGMTTLGARNSGVQLDSALTAPLAAQVRDNCIDLPSVRSRVVAAGQYLNDVGASFENNYDSTGENIVGQRFNRATFTTSGPGWYLLWGRKGAAPYHPTEKAGDMIGQLAVHTRALVGAGTVTLADGAGQVALPAMAARSRVQLTLQTAGGTPGTAVYATATPGTGFTARSSSPADQSTYAYRVDTGNESNVASVSVDVQNSPTASDVLTQIAVTNPANLPGETSCTKIKAYSAGGNEYLYGYFTDASIITVDIDCLTESGPSENDCNLPRGPETNGANGSSNVSTLLLDPAKGSGAAK